MAPFNWIIGIQFQRTWAKNKNLCDKNERILVLLNLLAFSSLILVYCIFNVYITKNNKLFIPLVT